MLDNSDEQKSSIGSTIDESLEDAARQRQQKINRINQLKRLEDALAKVKVEQRRNDDEATQVSLFFMKGQTIQTPIYLERIPCAVDTAVVCTRYCSAR